MVYSILFTIRKFLEKFRPIWKSVSCWI